MFIVQIDAILLGTLRIGHGYALSKHPVVLQQMKERDIAVEVNPLSNQVRMKHIIRQRQIIAY